MVRNMIAETTRASVVARSSSRLPSRLRMAAAAAPVDSGALRPVVARTSPFAELPQALADLAAGVSRGKLVVTMPD